MAATGKHVRDPREMRVGKHGVATRTGSKSILYVVFAVVLVAVVCLVPLSFARSHIGLDSQAFADSTRSAFSELSDTTPAAEDNAKTPTSKANFTSHVEAKMQNSVMSGGCEIVSLGIVLESMGINADLNHVVNDCLDIDGHFATGYSGNPYTQGGGYPPGIADAANKYLSELGETAQARNLTGYSFAELKGIVNMGYPVLVWTTMNMRDPQFAAAFDNGVEWYNNEHCAVLYGFSGDKVLVSDPLDGLVERDLDRFADLYAQCGSMALAIW